MSILDDYTKIIKKDMERKIEREVRNYIYAYEDLKRKGYIKDDRKNKNRQGIN